MFSRILPLVPLFALGLASPPNASAATTDGTEPAVITPQVSDWPKWKPLNLPAGEAQVVADCTASAGELFVASPNRVYIRSPFAADNWELVWEGANKDEVVRAIGTVDSPEGETLVVATNDGVWSVTWKLDSSTWPGFRYRFFARAIACPRLEPKQVIAVSREGAGGMVHGYITSGNGSVAAIRVGRNGLEIGSPVKVTVGAGEPLLVPLDNGFVAGSVYGESSVFLLDREGTNLISSTDLAELKPERTTAARVISICVDRTRRLLLAATETDLYVSSIPTETEPELTLAAVAYDSPSLIKNVFNVAGRFMLVTQSRHRDGESLLLWETWQALPPSTASEFARSASFSPTAIGGPQYASEALQVEDDRVWVRASDGPWWQWVPDRWLPAPDNDVLNDCWLKRGWAPGHARVLRALVDDQLYCAPPSGWWRVSGPNPEATTWMTRWLVPDPTGRSVWTVGDPFGNGAGRTGLLKFHTPNGFLEPLDSVTYGPGFIEVRRFAHREANGHMHWPITGTGVLLLPQGSAFYSCYAGVAQEVLTAEILGPDVGLYSLTPAARSGREGDAWLAILRRWGRTYLARIGLASATAANKAATLMCVTRELSGEAGMAAELVPDADGYVWLATRSVNEWVLERLSSGEPESAASSVLRIATLEANETPQFFIPSREESSIRTDHFLFSSGGQCIQIPHNQPFVPTPAEPYLVIPGVTVPGSQSPSPAVRLWPSSGENAVVVDAVVRSRALPPAEFPHWGYHLITLNRLSALNAPSWDRAWAISSSLMPSQGLSVTPLNGPGRVIEDYDRVVGWSLGYPEWIAWSGDLHPVIEFLTRDTTAHTSSSLVRLMGLKSAVEAVPLPDSAVASLVVSDATKTAWYLRPNGMLAVEDFLPRYVPMHLTVNFQDRPAAKFNLASNHTVPRELPYTARSVTAQFGPNYPFWWLPSTGAVQGILARWAPDDEWVAISTDGVVTGSLRTGAVFAFQFQDEKLPPVDPLISSEWSFQTAAVPPPPLPAWVAALMGVSFLAIVGLLAFVMRNDVSRWAAWRLLGKRWVIEAPTADLVTYVRRVKGRFELELQLGSDDAISGKPTAEVGVTNGELPPDPFAALRPELARVAPRTAVVQADPESFPFPWAQRLGSKWSSLEDSNGTTNSFLIAGQIARGPRQELPAVRSAADRRLIFAAVKCRNAWNGGDEILTAAWSAAEAAELFRVRGAKVLQPSENEQSAPRFLKRPIEAEDYLPDSRASHFLHALRHADVVHVIAHGSAEGLELSDQRATADIVGTDALRCRLLILASCSTADLAFSADAFLLPLVRRGINIVAPIAPIWDKYGSEFLLNLYEELVPVRGSAGKPFATCLASAVQRLRHRFKDHTDLARLEASVDRFMLFGNPTLYFNVVR